MNIRIDESVRVSRRDFDIMVDTVVTDSLVKDIGFPDTPCARATASPTRSSHS